MSSARTSTRTPTPHPQATSPLPAPSTALMTSALFLLPSSPVVLHVAANSDDISTCSRLIKVHCLPTCKSRLPGLALIELLQWKGMPACTRVDWLPAAVVCARGVLRANSPFSGLLVWHLPVQPFIACKQVRLLLHVSLIKKS